LQVDAGGVTLGYVATDPNYWTPLIQSDAASGLVVTFEVPAGATTATSVEFMASPNNGYPFLGLVQGRDSTDSIEEPGSFKYATTTVPPHGESLTVIQLSLSKPHRSQ
jgi:hypothetical protein